MSCDRKSTVVSASAVKNHLKLLEQEPTIQATMLALKKSKSEHYGDVCLLAARGLLLTHKGFRLRNLTNFYPQTPVSPPHPSVSRITTERLRKRPGLLAHFWQEKDLWMATLTPKRVVTGKQLAYVGLDEWSPLKKAMNIAVVIGTCGLSAIPGLFMWSVYERQGTLGGASTEYTDAYFKRRGYSPHGKPLRLYQMPRELGTVVNLYSERGALGEATE